MLPSSRDPNDEGPTRLVPANYKWANQRKVIVNSPIRLVPSENGAFLPRHLIEIIFQSLYCADRANLGSTCRFLHEVECHW